MYMCLRLCVFIIINFSDAYLGDSGRYRCHTEINKKLTDASGLFFITVDGVWIPLEFLNLYGYHQGAVVGKLMKSVNFVNP